MPEGVHGFTVEVAAAVFAYEDQMNMHGETQCLACRKSFLLFIYQGVLCKWNGVNPTSLS